MIKKFYLIALLFTSIITQAQNYIKHKVQKGETITQIALKYKVTPFDIYKLNPDSQTSIQPDSFLIIPSISEVKQVKPVAIPTSKSSINHIVQAKETVYSITKKYAISQAELEKNNPFIITDGLDVGQKLIIKNGSDLPPSSIPSTIKDNDIIIHQVQPKETKYGIAKKYDISVEELENQNPEIKENLAVGYQLKITKNSKQNTTFSAIKPVRQAIEKEAVLPMPAARNLYDYTVKQGETFYSLTHKFSISEASLVALNPELKDGVKELMVLKVPASISVKKEQKNGIKDFSKSITKQDKKQLVLFLPFNASKITLDSISIGEKLKKDKFLNMTLDFYAGALMAIDSAKVLGINVDVKIYDSEENKSNTTALETIQNNNFANVDAVIGPFYQNNIEKVAQVLLDKNIPVISPLSKEEGTSYANLFQSMPTNDNVKNALFDFMRAKEGNIVGIIDPKRQSIKQYFAENQRDIKLVGLAPTGTFVGDSIKKYLVKDKTNYIIMESQKTATIFTVLNTLIAASKNYPIQLVLLEPNETLDFEEIELEKLAKLKLMYPTVTRNNTTIEALKFEKKFRKKNDILPNQFAIRGFDITFDVLQRLSQSSSFIDDLKNIATEQVENKFDYTQKVSSGYNNDGIYIEYFDTDLTIKQAQ